MGEGRKQDHEQKVMLDMAAHQLAESWNVRLGLQKEARGLKKDQDIPPRKYAEIITGALLDYIIFLSAHALVERSLLEERIDRLEKKLNIMSN